MPLADDGQRLDTNSFRLAAIAGPTALLGDQSTNAAASIGAFSVSVASGAGPDRTQTKVYHVGGGIASLAAATSLIRDGHILGQNNTIFEELNRLGGSLDRSG